MLLCFIVYGGVLAFRSFKVVEDYHTEMHTKSAIYAKIASAVLERINCTSEYDIFDTQLKKIEEEEFKLNFCDSNYELTTEYFKKIGRREHQRYYASYHTSPGLQVLQKFSDAFLTDRQIEAAVLADINGYIPIHHSYASQMVVGTYAIDNLASRHCRKWPMFSGANFKQYYAVDTYYEYNRDTSTPIYVTGTPIYVNSKQWGSALIGYKLEPLHAQIALNWYYFIVATVLLGMVLLIALPMVKIDAKNT